MSTRPCGQQLNRLHRRSDVLRKPCMSWYDNALAETINGLYKTELMHKRVPWKTREAVELATLEWVLWFNEHRLLESIGYIPPAEAEVNYYRQLAKPVANVT